MTTSKAVPSVIDFDETDYVLRGRPRVELKFLTGKTETISIEEYISGRDRICYMSNQRAISFHGLQWATKAPPLKELTGGWQKFGCEEFRLVDPGGYEARHYAGSDPWRDVMWEIEHGLLDLRVRTWGHGTPSSGDPATRPCIEVDIELDLLWMNVEEYNDRYGRGDVRQVAVLPRPSQHEMQAAWVSDPEAYELQMKRLLGLV